MIGQVNFDEDIIYLNILLRKYYLHAGCHKAVWQDLSFPAVR
jgi:hypothetical protein